MADTRLPATNKPLFIGRGTLDFGECRVLLRSGGFTAPAILEIGGLPRSGSYGHDTDAARVDSLRRLRAARA